MSMISYQIVNRLVEQLTYDLITTVSSSDPTKAGEVKAYRFQQDPLTPVNFVWVSSGDFKDDSVRDGIVTAKDMETLKINLPAGEIGGGHYWWRRGVVQIGCYFITKSYSQDDAADYAHRFLGKITRSIELTNVSGLRDEFDEQAFYIWVPYSHFFESGGPPDQYIWRGDVGWQVLTNRPQ